MRALCNNFKGEDISQIFYCVELEKEWDELHTNGAVIMGFHSQLRLYNSPLGQRCSLFIKFKTQLFVLIWRTYDCCIWAHIALFNYIYVYICFEHVWTWLDIKVFNPNISFCNISLDEIYVTCLSWHTWVV